MTNNELLENVYFFRRQYYNQTGKTSTALSIYTTLSHFYLGIYDFVSSKFIIRFVCISQQYDFNKYKQTHNENYAVLSNLWRNIYFFVHFECLVRIAWLLFQDHYYPSSLFTLWDALLLSSSMGCISIVHCLRSLFVYWSEP